MSNQEQNNDLEKLFGTTLHTLITEALFNLHNSQKEFVILRDIPKQILITRPELNECLRTARDKENFKARIWNSIKQLNKTGTVITEYKKAPIVGTGYYIIYTKIN